MRKENRNQDNNQENNEESTENSQFAGMNKFGPISDGHDWNEDYNNPQYDTWESWGYGPPGLYGMQGCYTLKKFDEGEHEKCDEDCGCGFQKKETKWEKKNRRRGEAFKKGNMPGEVMSVGKAGKLTGLRLTRSLTQEQLTP